MPMSTRTHKIFVALAALLAAAACSIVSCQAELDGLRGTEKPGLDPPRDRFFFPTGLALTPDGRHLFVSNGNSDLKYNGGTVVVVDVVEALHRLENPDDHPESCRRAPQNPQLVECYEEDIGDPPRILKSALTVRMGFYPSFIALEELTAESCYQPPAGDDVHKYRIYTPVRGDPSLTYIDVFTNSDSDVSCLDCGEGCDKTDTRDCRGSHRIEAPSSARRDYVHGELPGEPFAMALEPNAGFVILAHLAGGSLSLVDLCGDPTDGLPDLVDVLVGVMGQDADGRSGGYNVVQRDTSDPDGWFYVSNRAAAQIVTLRVSQDETSPVADDRGLRLVLGPSVILTAPFGPLESGADVRGMAMSDDGNRLFALSRTPPSLVVVDTSLQDGQPRNEFLDVVEICPKPSVLRLRNMPDGRTLAYAVCFASGEIYVVDTHDAQVVDRIEAGGGPHDLVLMPSQVDPFAPQGFGFVSNFGEHTLGVIDLRPDSETYHQMIGRLGRAEELMQ